MAGAGSCRRDGYDVLSCLFFFASLRLCVSVLARGEVSRDSKRNLTSFFRALLCRGGELRQSLDLFFLCLSGNGASVFETCISRSPEQSAVGFSSGRVRSCRCRRRGCRNFVGREIRWSLRAGDG